MYCPNCGKFVGESNFCPECQSKIGNDETLSNLDKEQSDTENYVSEEIKSCATSEITNTNNQNFDSSENILSISDEGSGTVEEITSSQKRQSKKRKKVLLIITLTNGIPITAFGYVIIMNRCAIICFLYVRLIGKSNQTENKKYRHLPFGRCLLLYLYALLSISAASSGDIPARVWASVPKLKCTPASFPILNILFENSGN